MKNNPSVLSHVLDVAVSLAKVAYVDRGIVNENAAVSGFQEALSLLESLKINSNEQALEQQRLQSLSFSKIRLLRNSQDQLLDRAVEHILRKPQIRQGDKWELDLFGDEPRLSRSKVSKLDARDLGLKLQKRSIQQGPQSGGVCDMCENLSGSMHLQPFNVDPPNPKLASKPTRSVISEALVLRG